ncbi:MAG: ATP-binding protein [Desulfurivibrionaceae bacterium]
MGFLVYSQYQSQEELRKVSLTRFLHENEKRAMAVDYFMADRLGDLAELAENRELALYHENLALGMSIEYGLGAALIAAEESFEKSRTRLKLEKSAVYPRLVYLDESGNKLIDTHEPGLFQGEQRQWSRYLSSRESHATFMFEPGDNADGFIVISCPYTFKARYAGQLLAWLSVKTIYHHFIEASAQDSRFITTLLFKGEYIKVPEDADRVIAAALLPKARNLQPRAPFSLTVTARDNRPERILGMMSPVGETPFALAAFLPEHLDSGEQSPRRLLFTMAGFGLLILAGGIVILRIDMRNAVLQARLEEIALRQKIVAEQNANLRKLSTAVDQSANTVLIMTKDGTIEYVNPHFTVVSGYRPEEVIGNNFLNRWSAHNSKETLDTLWETINDGKQWTGELRNRKKSGEILWEQTTIAPVKDEQGAIADFIAIKEDITKRKEAEEEILRLNTDLEQRVLDRTTALQVSNRDLEKAYRELKAAQSQILQQEKMASIGQLAAGVAHEINNPTGFILSNLNSLKKYLQRFAEFLTLQTEALEKLSAGGNEGVDAVLQPVTEQRKVLKIDHLLDDIGPLIEESIEGGERVKKIVQSLKSFAHIDEAEYKPSDINAGLESSLAVVWNELKYKATVIRDYGEIPNTVCNLGQLNQVFVNILVNAAHALEKQGEITVKTRRDGETIRVAISDTGCGIPAETINRIFEPFFTTKEVGKGTGLGLSIAYDIVVKKHNGQIEVESEPGKGTTFTLTIPIVI